MLYIVQFNLHTNIFIILLEKVEQRDYYFIIKL